MARRSRLGKVADAVAGAARATAEAAGDYVVEPVAKALGLIGEAQAGEKPQPKAARKAARKTAVARAEEKARAARRRR